MHRDADHDISRINFAIRSDPFEVRQALMNLGAIWDEWNVAPDMRSNAEIAVGEALNNVVEHAHANRSDGKIEMEQAFCDDGLKVEIRDNGAPMPNEAVPNPSLASTEVALQELPEGGFGWFLIHQVTQDLQYKRKEGWNYLAFRIPCPT